MKPMRTKAEIMKDYVDMSIMGLLNKFKKAQIRNPKLQLEVLLDIRDLLTEIKDKSK